MNDGTRLSLNAAVDELISVGKAAVERGLVLASGGNLSARLDDERFVITAAGAWLDRLTPEQFAVLSVSGEALGSVNPSSEWKLHQRSYLARPDVNSVIHVHPQHAVLLDALGFEVRLMTLDHAFYVRSVGRTRYYPNGSDQLADSAARAAAEHDCVIMAHHGCSALGATISMAYRRAVNLEEAAVATYRALLLGDRTTDFPGDERAALQHS